MIEEIKTIGALAGLITLGWKLIELNKRFVTLKLKIDYEDTYVTAKTIVENKSFLKKEIDNSMLLIMPEDWNMKDFLKGLAIKHELSGITIKSVTDLGQFKHDTAVYFDQKYAIIPLKYYFDKAENLHIRDEILTYKCLVDKTKFEHGIYSVKFYLFSLNRLPRSTQDLMIIK